MQGSKFYYTSQIATKVNNVVVGYLAVAAIIIHFSGRQQTIAFLGTENCIFIVRTYPSYIDLFKSPFGLAFCTVYGKQIIRSEWPKIVLSQMLCIATCTAGQAQKFEKME